MYAHLVPHGGARGDGHGQHLDDIARTLRRRLWLTVIAADGRVVTTAAPFTTPRETATTTTSLMVSAPRITRSTGRACPSAGPGWPSEMAVRRSTSASTV